MSYERSLFFIGIWVAVLSFLGFPVELRKILFSVTGLLICLIAYFMYKRSLIHKIPRQRDTNNDISSPAL